jgi:hypothetical protein
VPIVFIIHRVEEIENHIWLFTITLLQRGVKMETEISVVDCHGQQGDMNEIARAERRC